MLVRSNPFGTISEKSNCASPVGLMVGKIGSSIPMAETNYPALGIYRAPATHSGKIAIFILPPLVHAVHPVAVIEGDQRLREG